MTVWRCATDDVDKPASVRSWSWITLDAYLVLATDRLDGLHVELGLPTSASRSADIDLLKEIAATLITPKR
jgi:hypothetical protein